MAQLQAIVEETATGRTSSPRLSASIAIRMRRRPMERPVAATSGRSDGIRGEHERQDDGQPQQDAQDAGAPRRDIERAERLIAVGMVVVPVLVAVQQDASGQAWDLTLSYAKAIGGTRAGAIKTTFAEETATHLFGSQAVLCGGVSSLVQSGIEVLTEAGYQPEVAYFACLLELKQVVDLMYRAGIAQQRRLVGDVAEYGDYTSGPYLIDDSVKQRMRDVLTAVQDGSWAADFVADQDAGAPRLRYFRQRSEFHPMEQTGREMRLLMSGVRAFDDGDADLG